MSRCQGISPSDEVTALDLLRSSGDAGVSSVELGHHLFPGSPPAYDGMVRRHAVATLRRLEHAGMARFTGRRWVLA